MAEVFGSARGRLVSFIVSGKNGNKMVHVEPCTCSIREGVVYLSGDFGEFFNFFFLFNFILIV